MALNFLQIFNQTKDRILKNPAVKQTTQNFLSSPIGALVQRKPQEFIPRTQKLVQKTFGTPEGRKEFLAKFETGFGAHGAGVGAFIKKPSIPTKVALPPPPQLPTSRMSSATIPRINQSVPQIPSLPPIIPDPVNKIISALKEAKPIRAQQESLYTKARGERLSKVLDIRGQREGETGFFRELGALKGELPKVQYESIRNKVTQQDVDDLFNQVKDSPNITDWEKINAQTGLAKVLSKEGGGVPTEGELRLLNDVFGKEFTKTVLSKRPFAQKALSAIGEVLNLPRALVASMDLSAPLRQGIFLIGRPKRFAQAFGSMFKQFGSQKAYNAVQENIKQKPTYQAMRDHGLSLTDLGSLGSREEAFMSNLAEKIPVLGGAVKASNRAYSGFLNKLRADTFDDIATKVGNNDPVFLKSLADYVNSATGRGNLPKTIQGAAPVFNGAFFSPRLMASRANLLNPVYYARLHPEVRKEALKDLLKTTGVIMSVLGLAKLGGATVSGDPRNADFGKIKIGNTRHDITGGFQPYIRLMGQLISGQVVSSTTGKVMTLGEGFRPLTRKEIIYRFFEGKFSPVASFVADLLRGTNAVGEPLNFAATDPTKNPIGQRLVPLVVQDLKEAYDEYTATGNISPLTPLTIFGTSSQTYGGTPTTIEEAEQRGSGDLYKFLKSRPAEEANKYLEGVYDRDPQKYNKIQKFKEIEDVGLGQPEFNMVNSSIKTGERTTMITDELNKRSSKEEKNEYIDKLYDLGIMNDDVYDQLLKLKDQGKLKSPGQQGNLLNKLIPEAKAYSEEKTGPFTTTYKMDFRNESGKTKGGLINPFIESKNVKEIKQSNPLPKQAVAQNTVGDWRSKYDDVYKTVTQKKGLPTEVVKLLVTSENGREDPQRINKNSDGTWDIGLLQINVDPSNKAEMEKLKDPNYNIEKGLEIYRRRVQNLKDPVLALASYNLGAGGAVLSPEKALARAKKLYAHAGLKMPETEFTKNPLAFVRKNMDYYKSIGLFKN